MYFMGKEEKAFEKHMEIWGKVSSVIKNKAKFQKFLFFRLFKFPPEI